MSEIRKKISPMRCCKLLEKIPHHGLLGTWTEFQYRTQYQIVCYRVCVFFPFILDIKFVEYYSSLIICCSIAVALLYYNSSSSDTLL